MDCPGTSRLSPAKEIPGDTPADRQATLLIGTALSVSQLAHTLAIAKPQPEVVGCVLPKVALKGEAGPDLPCKTLGAIDELDQLLDQFRPQLVLVSLPLAMRQAIGQTAASWADSG